MSEQAAQSPEQKFRDALKHILTVPKAEVLRREAEAKERRKQVRKKDGNASA